MESPASIHEGAIRRPILRRYRSVAITGCVGVILSVVMFVMLRGREQVRLQTDFERRAGNLAVTLQRGTESSLPSELASHAHRR